MLLAARAHGFMQWLSNMQRLPDLRLHFRLRPYTSWCSGTTQATFVNVIMLRAETGTIRGR